MSKSPSDVAEILSRVALFVSVKDALSCARVSKAFSQDFAYAIWHCVDFNRHQVFVESHPATISKNGHLIRAVKHIKKQVHLDSLQYLNVCKLRSLNLDMTNDPLFKASCHDLLRRNRNTLTRVVINNADGTKRTSTAFMPLDSLTSTTAAAQSSNLTALTVRWLTLTRESFTAALRSCPALVNIDIWGLTLIPGRFFDEFQHSGVTFLQAMIVDAVTPVSPPVLAHFPNLKQWATGDDSTPSEFPTLDVKNAIAIWCPHLKEIQTNFTPSPLLYHLLINVFVNLTSLTFDYQHISPDLILAILRYPANWTAIVTYTPRSEFMEEFEETGIPETVDHFQSSGWMIQSLPRFCHRLTTFKMVEHQMDVDELELAPWLCTNLEELAVRIQGLDTRDKIEDAVARWREGRKRRKLGLEAEALVKEDGSIEARVAQHLLQFKNLNSVWLGSKVWKV
ncbi:hypothetical protein BGZ92_005583 [Podila epicladia]|nr:hypothetical protein BGZ92_005583 [Podila epicladia]